MVNEIKFMIRDLKSVDRTTATTKPQISYQINLRFESERERLESTR